MFCQTLQQNQDYFWKKHKNHHSWTLPYTRALALINHSFFDVLPQVDMRSILYFVNQQCNFLDNFEHILGHYANQKQKIILSFHV